MSMQAILSASQSLSRMQTLQSAKSQVQGAANILRSESKLDGGNVQKEAKADELEKKTNSIMGDLMGEITGADEEEKIDEAAKAEEAAKADEAVKDESAKKLSKTDTVELSKAAKQQLGKSRSEKPTLCTTVTYSADGSIKQSAAADAAPRFAALA